MANDSKLQAMWDNPLGTAGAAKAQVITPFWSLDLDDKEALAKWFKTIWEFTQHEISQRLPVWQDNLRFFDGEHFGDMPTRKNSESESRKKNSPPISVPIITGLIEKKVSKITSTKTSYVVLPSKDDHQSRNNARFANYVIKYLRNIHGVRKLEEDFSRHANVLGESYLFTSWNPYKGPVLGEVDAEKIKREIVGKDKEDKPIYASAIKTEGEVDIQLVTPDRVRWEPFKSFGNSDYVFIEQQRYLHEVIAEFGKFKLVDCEGEEKNIAEMSDEWGKVQVVLFFHKEVKFLAGGRHLVFINGCVAENKLHPYNKNKHPIVQLSDVDINLPEGSCARPRSSVENIKGLNRAYDGVMFLILKAFAQAAHLKWIIQKRSCNIKALADLATVVEYGGGVPPRLEMPQTLRPEMFALKEDLKKEMREIAGAHGVSFGDVPKRVDSSLAIQHLEEQETKGELSPILKFTETMRDVWDNAVYIAGRYYSKATERINILIGRDNDFEFQKFKGADIVGPFSIEIVNTAPANETVSGKTQRLIDMRREFGPGVVPDDFVIDALDIVQPEKYISYATAAVRKAEAQIDALKSGFAIEDPQPYEDMISKWRIFMRFVQGSAFAKLEDDIKQRTLEHIGGLEYLMWERTTDITGRGFAAQLQALPAWPAVFRIPKPELNPGNQEGAVPGAPIGLQEQDPLAAQQSQQLQQPQQATLQEQTTVQQ